MFRGERRPRFGKRPPLDSFHKRHGACGANASARVCGSLHLHRETLMNTKVTLARMSTNQGSAMLLLACNDNSGASTPPKTAASATEAPTMDAPSARARDAPSAPTPEGADDAPR